jgi:hypothetical protein
MSLFDQATVAGWIDRSEASLRNFVAAVPANFLHGDTVRIFVTIVQRRLWHDVILEQERRAGLAIDRFRGRRRGRVSAAAPSNEQGARPPKWSAAPDVVHTCLRLAPAPPVGSDLSSMAGPRARQGELARDDTAKWVL